MSSPFLLLLAVAVLALIGLVVVVIRRSPAAADEASLRLTQWCSVAIAVGVGVISLVNAALVIFDTGRLVSVTIPVRENWPALNPDIVLQPPTATRVSGGYLHAELSVSGLELGTRILIATGGLLGAGLTVALALLVFQLCRRVRAAEPFAPALYRTALVAAAVVLVCGLTGQVLSGLGEIRASQEVLFIGAWSGEQGDNAGYPQPTFNLSLSFWPFGLSFALVALAELVRRGQRLSIRATALEQEANDLREDTRGLV